MAKDESRAAIRIAIQRLVCELNECTVTTHGIIGDGSIEKVARALVECHNDPSPYNAGTLVQLANQFLRATDAVPQPQRR